MSEANMSPESGLNEDIGGNVVVASTNLGDTPPVGQHENNRTPLGRSQDTTAGRDPLSPPAKRTKRGKYISRAWYVQCIESGDVSRLIWFFNHQHSMSATQDQGQ